MKFVNSKIKLNIPRIRQLDKATTTALEKTTVALHTEVVNAQVMPFGDNITETYKEYGTRGQFAKNGREYKGKERKRTIHKGGTLQNIATFPDFTDSKRGITRLVSSTPYARRLYFHPEYHFNEKENKNAKGKWYEQWISGKNKDFAQKTFAKFYKEEAGL